MTETRKMYVSRLDRLSLSLSFVSGTFEVPLDLGVVAEYVAIVERYESLMRKLWLLHEEARIDLTVEEDHAAEADPVSPMCDWRLSDDYGELGR